jgi:hypothetical protein
MRQKVRASGFSELWIASLPSSRSYVPSFSVAEAEEHEDDDEQVDEDEEPVEITLAQVGAGRVRHRQI